MKKNLSLFLIVLLSLTAFVACQKDPHIPCVDGVHDWKIVNEKAATCTEKGFKKYECSRCKETKEETFPTIEHTLTDESRICSVCQRAIYKSLEDFNKDATLENTKNVINEITLGENSFKNIQYWESNSGYRGDGLLIGRTDNPLNKYGAKPAEQGEYKFIFKNGIIDSSAKGYTNIDNFTNTAVYMLIPGNSEVTFEDVTFNGVFSFGIQVYTSPWSFLKKLEFKDCIFNGILVGSCNAEDYIFDGCTFNNYSNSIEENNSNPLWIRGNVPSWSGDISQQPASLKTFIFKNNTVYSSRPVKIEAVGKNSQSLGYIPQIKILDNYFDISYENTTDKPDVAKHMALNIGQFDKTVPIHLYDDGNKISEGTTSLYTAAIGGNASNCYYEVPGSKIMDRNENDKIIEGVVWKSNGKETFTMTTISKQ